MIIFGEQNLFVLNNGVNNVLDFINISVNLKNSQVLYIHCQGTMYVSQDFLTTEATQTDVQITSDYFTLELSVKHSHDFRYSSARQNDCTGPRPDGCPAALTNIMQSKNVTLSCKPEHSMWHK